MPYKNIEDKIKNNKKYREEHPKYWIGKTTIFLEKPGDFLYVKHRYIL